MSNSKMVMSQAANSQQDPFAWDLSYAYYDESGAWDLSYTNSIQSGLFNVSTQETAPVDVFLSSDGTKMYVIGTTGDDVNEYSLSTPWNIATASYSKVYSFSARETSAAGIFFRDDGSKMYIIGTSSNAVNEFNLSTPWDVATASYVQRFIVSAQGNNPFAVFFKPDGAKMYVVGYSDQEVNEYTLSTPWSVSTASFTQAYSLSATSQAPVGLFFKPDGTKMYVSSQSSPVGVLEYALTTPWDVSTSSYSKSFSTLPVITAPRGIYFRPDGTNLYVLDSSNDRVLMYDVGGLDVENQDPAPHALFFKPDGTKLYIIGQGNDSVIEYNLSTPWETATASYLQNFSVAAQEASPTGLFFKPDGTKMYVIGASGDDVNEYSLSTPWDVSTATYVRVFSVAGQETVPEALFFKSDGTKMYIIGQVGDDVNEYSLSTAWDVSTASYVQNFSIAAQETGPTGLFFKPDGRKMYVVGGASDNVNEYNLSVAWNISTASYIQNFNISQNALPEAVFFKDDGTKMFVVGSSSYQRVYTYTLAPQP